MELYNSLKLLNILIGVVEVVMGFITYADIGRDHFYVGLVVICLVLSVTSAAASMTGRNKIYKDADIAYQVLASVLLTTAGILYIVSTTEMKRKDENDYEDELAAINSFTAEFGSEPGVDDNKKAARTLGEIRKFLQLLPSSIYPQVQLRYFNWRIAAGAFTMLQGIFSMLIAVLLGSEPKECRRTDVECLTDSSKLENAT